VKSRFNFQIDLHLLTVILITAIVALPFLTRSGLPRHTDLELHVFRAAEYGHVLSEGVLYPRWAPDFYYGYGYPIFNYYAPFTYALASLFAIPFGIIAGVKGVILLAFFLAAVGMYYFARRHFGSSAGVIASAAFVLSPYILFIDPLMRGDLAEFFALCLIPWVFLVFDEPAIKEATEVATTSTQGRPLSAGLMFNRRIAMRALVLGVLILSHNLMALFALAILIAYLIWRGLFIDKPRRWIADAASIVFALLLTSIFWLPFFAERNAIRLDVAGPGHFDYHNHFIQLSMLLLPSPSIDLGATTPKFIYNLGLVQWLLIVPAAWLAFRKRAESSSKITLFFILISVPLILLITPVSETLWDAIPASAYIQFPWRLLGPVAFVLALGASSLFGGKRQEAGSTTYTPRATRHTPRITHYSLLITRYLPAIILFALLISALPTMYPPLWDASFGDTSPRGMIDFELSGVALGTTSTGDFQPVQIGRLPKPTQTLLDSYSSGILDKFDHASLPNGTTVQVEQHSATFDRFTLNTPASFQARVLTFYFLGWQVTLDGNEVPITPADQDGFITFPVPSGSHTIEVTLRLTTPQLIGTIISLATLLALFVMLTISSSRSPAVPPSRYLAISPSLLLAICIVFLAGKILIVDRCDSCFRYTSPIGQALGAQYKQTAHFGGHIDLLGYDLPSNTVEAGQSLPLTLYWRATAPVPVNYQVFAHLTKPDTVLWGQSDKLNPGDFPTTRWPLDKFVWDDHSLVVLPGTPPGEYRISIGLYILENGQRAPIFDDKGQIVSDNVVLNQVVHVVRPNVAPSIDSLQIQNRLNQDFSGAMLLGWSIESSKLSPPNFTRLTLYWRSDADRLPNLRERAELIASDERVVQTIESYPVQNAYPMAQWVRGEIVRDQIAFWLPPDFSTGKYLMRVSLLAESGSVLKSIDVTEIEIAK
jgi:hypothetical protein